MERNETEKKQINEADYIDITVFIRAFLRLARKYFLLVCAFFICLTAVISIMSRVMVKEQHVAEVSFVIGVKLLDDFSYNYTLTDIREDYITQMSDAFQSVISSEYMQDLLYEELGRYIPGEINWQSTYGTNLAGINVVSDSLENAVQLRDAVITCLPTALFSTIGDIELKVLGTSEQTEVSHEELASPIIWVGAGAFGSIFAYLGIIFFITLWHHDIETSEDMAKITDLPCLGNLPKTGKRTSKTQSNSPLVPDINDAYNRSFSEFRIQMEEVLEEQQVKILLFTGGYKKRGQKKILEKLVQDWMTQGRKVHCINMSLSKGPNTTVQIQEELNQQIEESLKENDLIIINGPGYEQAIELLSIADCVDGIVYIVKAGYEQMKSADEAICSLGFTHAKFLGYVITA